MKFFRIKLDIGIAGGVVADHYVVSDGLLRFYSADDVAPPVAVYALASVASVEEVPRQDDLIHDIPRSMGLGQRRGPGKN